MIKKSKILILIPSYKAIGGIKNYYFSLRPYLPDYIKYLTRGSRTWPNRKNMIIEALRLLSDFFIYICYLLFFRIKLVQITTAFSLKSIQRDSIYIIIAILFRKKVIVFFRGWDENSFSIFEGKSFYKKTFFRSDAIIDLRQANIDQLKKWGYTNKTYLETTVVDNSLIPYITNLDLETKFKNKTNKSITILFLARLEIRKGIYEAINTVELLKVKYPEINFIIAGDGSEENKAKKYCKEKKMENIDFQGFVSGFEKSRCYLNADIYLFPSYSEGMPSSVLEAMSFGLPVVTANVGGLSDFFINEKHGFIVERNEPEILCESVSKIIDNKDLMYSIAINNYLIAQDLFIPEKVNKRILKIFEETLN
jgi:glycosyltransferase involved in cell wall biosynthesis